MPIIKIQRVFYEVSWNYEMTQVLFKRNLPLNVALTSGGKGSVSACLIFLELCWVVCWCSPIVYRKKKNASDLASVLIVASCKKSLLEIHFEEYVIIDFNRLQANISKRSNLSEYRNWMWWECWDFKTSERTVGMGKGHLTFFPELPLIWLSM